MWIATLFAACLLPWLRGAQCQSVSEQCLTEQIRNSRLPARQELVQDDTAEEATLRAFQSICINYPEYINCFLTRLPDSDDVSDRFLSLVFDRQSMTTAYRGLCHDLGVIKPRMKCLLSTPQVRHCYGQFNQHVQTVVKLQRQGDLPGEFLEEMACNASISRYQCETAVYRFCDQKAGEIMQDFFYAGVPQKCRDITAVESRYTLQARGSASHVKESVTCMVLTLLVTFRWMGNIVETALFHSQ